LSEPFERLRSDPELSAERELLPSLIEAEPDKTLAFVAEMAFDAPEGPVVYACPMHPDVVQDEPRTLPALRDDAAGKGGAHDLRLPDARRGR
jgi:hypothetical protein